MTTIDQISITWKGATMLVIARTANPGETYTTLKLVEGSWPSPTELLKLCDGSPPDHPPAHFGGRVIYVNEDVLCVTVFID